MLYLLFPIGSFKITMINHAKNSSLKRWWRDKKTCSFRQIIDSNYRLLLEKTNRLTLLPGGPGGPASPDGPGGP